MILGVKNSFLREKYSLEEIEHEYRKMDEPRNSHQLRFFSCPNLLNEAYTAAN
jgi:hypothetical protein